LFFPILFSYFPAIKGWRFAFKKHSHKKKLYQLHVAKIVLAVEPVPTVVAVQLPAPVTIPLARIPSSCTPLL
jgi:hypothetical protein